MGPDLMALARLWAMSQFMNPPDRPMNIDPMMQARVHQMQQQQVPVDYQGLDPEMAQLMQGEADRLMKQRAMYSPQTLK